MVWAFSALLWDGYVIRKTPKIHFKSTALRTPEVQLSIQHEHLQVESQSSLMQWPHFSTNWSLYSAGRRLVKINLSLLSRTSKIPLEVFTLNTFSPVSSHEPIHIFQEQKKSELTVHGVLWLTEALSYVKLALISKNQ